MSQLFLASALYLLTHLLAAVSVIIVNSSGFEGFKGNQTKLNQTKPINSHKSWCSFKLLPLLEHPNLVWGTFRGFLEKFPPRGNFLFPGERCYSLTIHKSHSICCFQKPYVIPLYLIRLTHSSFVNLFLGWLLYQVGQIHPTGDMYLCIALGHLSTLCYQEY